MTQNPLEALSHCRPSVLAAIPEVLQSLRRTLFIVDPSNRVEGVLSLADRLTMALQASNNPLLFWKGLIEINPTYAAVTFVAEIFFCIPATSAPAERIFSGTCQSAV